MSWAVGLLESAARDLRRLEQPDRESVERKIAALAAEAPNLDIKKLQGSGALWRVRAGRFRVVFQRDSARHAIVVVAIAHRKEAYL